MNERLHRITSTAIEGARRSGVDTEVLVLESSKEARYADSTILRSSKEDFNYNRLLNEGVRVSEGEHLAFCNNDLVFSDNWAANLLAAMRREGCASGSPWCPRTHDRIYGMTRGATGWTPGRLFAGWCFVWSRELYHLVGGLDERYSFYCADNIAALQGEAAGANHLLSSDSQVEHLLSQTSRCLDSTALRALTLEQVKKFNRNHNENILGWGT